MNDSILENTKWSSGSMMSLQKPGKGVAFQQYIENGGAWLGFHVAAYNDKDSSCRGLWISSVAGISHQQLASIACETHCR